jgi:hypothetical protein
MDLQVERFPPGFPLLGHRLESQPPSKKAANSLNWNSIAKLFLRMG